MSITRFGSQRFHKVSRSQIAAAWADETRSHRDLAAEFGMSAEWFRKLAVKVSGHGRRVGRKAEIHIPDLEAMWTAGISAREIADAFGCHRNSVIKIAERAGLPARGARAQPKMTLTQWRETKLAAAMAESAKAEQAQFLLAEMVDSPRGSLRRVA